MTVGDEGTHSESGLGAGRKQFILYNSEVCSIDHENAFFQPLPSHPVQESRTLFCAEALKLTKPFRVDNLSLIVIAV